SLRERSPVDLFRLSSRDQKRSLILSYTNRSLLRAVSAQLNVKEVSECVPMTLHDLWWPRFLQSAWPPGFPALEPVMPRRLLLPPPIPKSSRLPPSLKKPERNSCSGAICPNGC